MNKNYMAAFGAIAASALWLQTAQAQTNVQIYGRFNMDVESIRTANTTGNANGDLTRMSSNSSRLGFRGTEDLGGNLKALFQIESAINPDSGSGTLGGRDTFVGLQGNWGKVRLGIMDDVFKEMGGLTDRFLGTGVQDDGGLVGLGGGGSGFTRRQKNSLRYDSPEFSGFSGHIQYGLEDEAAVDAKTSLTTGVTYASGRLSANAAYAQHRNFTLDRSDKAYRMSAKYDFGRFDIGGGVSRLDYDLAAGDIKRDYWTVSTGIKVGSAGVISLKYGIAGDGRGSAANGTVSPVGGDGARIFKGANSGAKLITVGYEHNLSKRTQLYTYYTRISNEANANYRFGTNGVDSAAAGAGADPSAFVVGIVHNF